MLGRGTRLCPELFGPGKDKESFYVFDYCQNLEFFSQNPPLTEGASGESLGKRLFTLRLELIGELDRAEPPPPPAGPNTLRTGDPLARPTATQQLRAELATLLRTEVAAMNLDNFIVRPKRRLVEQYAKPEAWSTLSDEARRSLAHEVAGLPSGLEPEEQEAKRFDLLLLKLQVALLRKEPAFKRLCEQVQGIASLLEEKTSIPMVHAELELIQSIQTDEWWQDVTLPMLENARKRLRALIKFIDKHQRRPIYTDFEDELGTETAVELPSFTAPDAFERFRAKARVFLRQHENHVAIYKLRMNKPLTKSDLEELERMLRAAGIGDAEALEKARAESHGLGLFIRSLVGLDRRAAKDAFGAFLSGRAFTASQIEFVDLMVNHLTDNGVMSAELLYESPFTDFAPTGPDGLFSAEEIEALLSVLEGVRTTAIAT
jgi:type I restriction enzyme R subunit